MLSAGQREKCPYDGAELRPVDLREAFAARAIQQNAAIEVVESSDFLDQHEGVGALLRYRDNARTA
jgi:peptide subunit release factor 1 (eRF1)